FAGGSGKTFARCAVGGRTVQVFRLCDSKRRYQPCLGPTRVGHICRASAALSSGRTIKKNSLGFRYRFQQDAADLDRGNSPTLRELNSFLIPKGFRSHTIMPIMQEELTETSEHQSPEIDSKYRLIIVAAKRSKQLQRGARPRIDIDPAKHKPTRI